MALDRRDFRQCLIERLGTAALARHARRRRPRCYVTACVFEHNGSVATLEDWFDPNRLRDDYVPTGFKGHGVQPRTVTGHEFGCRRKTSAR